jgi:integration host factor subunit beta
MTASDLIKRLSEKYTELPPSDIDTSVRAILKVIGDQLAQGGRVELRGFGSFQNHITPAKKGRNPKNGEIVNVPQKRRPYFKAGKQLRERVDGTR